MKYKFNGIQLWNDMNLRFLHNDGYFETSLEIFHFHSKTFGPCQLVVAL